MADALAYAVAELEPAVVVDIATLTGAIKVALGQQVGGLFANDDALAGVLRDAGDVSGEPVWRFPLASVYEEKISSRIADADNAGGGPGRDHRGAVPPALRRRGPVGAPRHRLHR